MTVFIRTNLCLIQDGMRCVGEQQTQITRLSTAIAKGRVPSRGCAARSLHKTSSSAGRRKRRKKRGRVSSSSDVQSLQRLRLLKGNTCYFIFHRNLDPGEMIKICLRLTCLRIDQA